MVKKGKKKENYIKEKRQIIINAALKVFAQKGFTNSKISDIAKEAGVADGTIYIYFKKKDDIIISLFENKMGEFNQLLKKEINKEKTPVEKLKKFISVHLNTLSKNKELAEIFTIELRQSAKFMENYHNTELKDYAAILIEIIEQGKKAEYFKEEIPTSIIWQFIFGILDQIVLNWVRKEKSTAKSLQNMIRFVLLFILDALLIKKEEQ